MSKNKTAVDWLVEQLEADGVDMSKYPLTIRTAKGFEKSQHGVTWNKAIDSYIVDGLSQSWEEFDNYYKNEYEKE